MISLLDWIVTVALVAATWQINAAALQRQARAETQHLAGKPAAGPESPVAPDSLHTMLQHIERKGGFTDLPAFIAGAGIAYERIAAAFASGQLDEVSSLLAPAVRNVFSQAIAARRAQGHVVSMTFVGLAAADPVDAGLDAGTAWIEMRFLAQMVCVTTDSQHRIVDGHPSRTIDISERWTFVRELNSNDPNWTLVATDEDA